MKSVALTLVVLLFAGARARTLQADAPSQFDHVKAAIDVYLTQAKDSMNKALDHLDETEFKEYKKQLSEGLDQLYDTIQKSRESATPYVQHLLVLTADMRQKIMSDIDGLRKDLEPKREELRQVLQNHFKGYQEKLSPLFKEYAEKHRSGMEELKQKVRPIMAEMRQTVLTNIEETKSKMVPIVEIIRAKANERIEELKTIAEPFFQEYREQFVKTVANLKETREDLQNKLKPITEEMKKNVEAMFNIIKDHFAA